MAYLDETGAAKETLIVFTSDHGDYLGDHWLGEKELFHDASARIPMIVVDPSRDADATRGQVLSHLVEAIDLAPTFVDWAGGAARPHILEGHSLLQLTRGKSNGWRRHVISEYDYSMRLARQTLNQPIPDCRLVMVFDGRWKMTHAEGFRPMLYDLQSDPQELVDIGNDPANGAVISRLTDVMNTWARRHHARVTISDDTIAARAGGELRRGYAIGFWDQDELDAARADGVSGN
jgi:arylsulfatase A-like enzyme